MEKKKPIVATAISLIILLTLLSPLFTARASSDPEEWYTTVSGVLDSDYYVLYPFSAKSLNVGFSKYGEVIGIPAGADQSAQANWVGLEYDGRDPFCPADTIDMADWINGWFIDVQYICPVWSSGDVRRGRHLWAYAMFADGFGWGGNWTWCRLPGDSPHGGRKTNGTCVTENLTILYNGPRRFVAMSVTHLYDKEEETTWPVLDVIITLIFNKVKKEIILLKDIKLTIDKMKLHDYVDVQFSNREEYDLGPSPSYSSYAHYYHQEGNTSYGPDWHIANELLRHNVSHLTGVALQTTYNVPVGTYGLADGFMMIWIDGVYKDHTEYTVNWANKQVTFDVAPGAGCDIELHYKFIKKTSTYWAAHHEYDIAQIISSDRTYVAWAGLWPPVSDYTVDGIARFLDPLVMVNEADMSVEPKRSPLLIGEWDFNLEPDQLPQFRCVEVKGVTDLHDADDLGITGVTGFGAANTIDTEVLYQLDEVFLPWDLESAVHKKTRREVDFYTVTVSDAAAAAAGTDLAITLGHSPVHKFTPWEKYCNFSERVLWSGALKYPYRSILTTALTYDYLLTVATSGVGTVTIPYTKVPAAGTRIKILYSTYTEYSNWDNIDKTWTDEIEYTRAPGASTDISKTYTYTIIDPLGANHTLYIKELKFTVTDLVALDLDHTYTFTGTMDFYEEDFKVFKEGSTTINCYWWDQDGPHGGRMFKHAADDGTIKVDFWDFWMQWYITPPAGEDLHVDWLHLDVDYTITVFYNGTTGNYTITTNFNVNGGGGFGLPGTIGTWTDQLYVERVPGRYEWTIVGRDAHTADSIGAALVTPAVKNKQVELGNAGMDMMYHDWGLSCIPNVMDCFGTAPGARADYKDDGSTPGDRTALKDDWCTYWPIASSNMISVGGPLANLLTLYFNDFTDAFWGINCAFYGETYTPYEAWQDKIVALTCWNKTSAANAYQASIGAGYAVIATYKDINGTVGLVIWGIGARDSFYACQWLHGDVARGISPGIVQLQAAPTCLTSIILEIDYTPYTQHPTFSIVECLGTISETLWTHGTEEKGGIHDCP